MLSLSVGLFHGYSFKVFQADIFLCLRTFLQLLLLLAFFLPEQICRAAKLVLKSVEVVVLGTWSASLD